MTNKILTLFYVVLTSLFLVGILLSFYDYSYLGYYSDKVINWLWLGFTLIIILRFWKRKSIKILTLSLSVMVGLSILPMAIPFFGIVYYFSILGDYQQIQLNTEYRIERTKHSALAGQRIYVYEKQGILEKNICRPIYAQIVDEVWNSDKENNSIDMESLPIKGVQLIGINKNEIEIEYEISDRKKSIIHKLNTDDGY